MEWEEQRERGVRGETETHTHKERETNSTEAANKPQSHVAIECILGKKYYQRSSVLLHNKAKAQCISAIDCTNNVPIILLH